MKTVFLLSVLLMFTAAVHADPIKGVAAGIIPYTCSAKGALYLLAYDPDLKRKAWGAFGGRPEKNEPGTQTALREFHEETNCVYDLKTIERFQLKGPSRSGNFYSYVTEVPYRDVADIAAQRKCTNVERAFWVWVPHAAFIKMLEKEAASPVVEIHSKPTIKFYVWEGAARSLRKALADGLLRRKDPCMP